MAQMKMSTKMRLKRSKVNAKHKIRLDSEADMPYFHKFVFRSVRSKVLQQLLFVYYSCTGNGNFPMYKVLNQRYIDANRDKPGYTRPETITDLIQYLTPEDIAEMLRCSSRTAREYWQVLRQLKQGHNEDLVS